MSSGKWFSLLLILLSLAGCSGIAARGSVGGQTIETRVDSEVARYYLEIYLAGRRADPVLDERLDRLYPSGVNGLSERDELKRLSDEFSVDLAALYLTDRIARLSNDQRFRNAFERARELVRGAVTSGRVQSANGAREYEILLVPTYLYKRLPATGADLAVPRAALQRFGLTCHFVETVEDGAIETNAGIVAAAIKSRLNSGRRLILISASKSGPEVALALTGLGDSETRHVAAWINTVGALQGTPLADERLLPEIEDLIGPVDSAGMESLKTERSRQRFASFHVPANVLIVNYFGIPLSGSVSSWARAGFARLQKYGPNDGILLLSDMIFPGGITVAELGLDHFLLDRHIDVTTVALTMTVIEWNERHRDKGNFVRGN
jgi:hypothetical protein